MSLRHHSLTPRLRPLSPRRGALLSVLDIGTTKIVCLVAKLEPAAPSDALRGRSHSIKLIGIGHQKAQGLKSGVVVDLEAVETAIRLALDAAERMAKVEIRSAIVAMTGGRLGSESFHATVPLRGQAVADHDVQRVLEAASATGARPGRAVLHSLPTGYALDASSGIRDPRGMVGEHLGADLHIVSSEQNAIRNLMLAIERCHIDIGAVVASPYAAGLASLVDDEALMGAAVIDLGGGTTGMGVFAGGHLVHVDAIAVGAHHVTMDIARGLATTLAHAERLKTLYGSTLSSPSDDRETVAVPSVDGDDRDKINHVPKSHLVRIMRPRVEEILELVRDRLRQAGFAAEASRRVVLTGGGAQLTGLPDLARRIISKQVRVGRPLGVQGLPEAGRGPGFAAPVGLLVYPQVAGLEHFEPRSSKARLGTGTDGYLSRMGRWMRESF
jgi:cell division protein FtsA